MIFDQQDGQWALWAHRGERDYRWALIDGRTAHDLQRCWSWIAREPHVRFSGDRTLVLSSRVSSTHECPTCGELNEDGAGEHQRLADAALKLIELLDPSWPGGDLPAKLDELTEKHRLSSHLGDRQNAAE